MCRHDVRPRQIRRPLSVTTETFCVSQPPPLARSVPSLRGRLVLERRRHATFDVSSPSASDHARTARADAHWPDFAPLSQILDLLAEDSRPNVYAGKLEVRPPAAPTTNPQERRSAVVQPVPTHR